MWQKSLVAILATTTATTIATEVSSASTAAEATTTTAQRVEVPFQYGWRFHYGDDPSSPPESGPGTEHWDQDLQGYLLCEGIESAPNRFSEKDCRLACAYDPNCLVWQQQPLEYGRSCHQAYTGMNVTCKPDPKNQSTWGGGRRFHSPDPAFRTDYSFATATADSSIDAKWDVVDAPHDFISSYGNFTNNVENFKQGYLPRNASWYRKHFNLPQDWSTDGGATFVHFEGVFHHATIFLNGKYLAQHECGYTGFDIRLDNATGIKFGTGSSNANVLSVRADASFGSGHWYEGGGIYRPVQLVHTSTVFIVRDGLYAAAGRSTEPIELSAELETTGTSGSKATVTFILQTRVNETSLANVSTATVDVPPFSASGAATVIATASLTPPASGLTEWTTQNPTMYQVKAEVTVGGAVVDVQTVAIGFRKPEFTAGKNGNAPFSLNGQAISFRGFSHHNSIGGLGVAIPERVELFRVQATRALGSNIWRMSHNPYTPSLYDLLDELGQMCWDENRDYGAKYGSGAYAVAMHDMVKRDRNHPSVIMWSFCNEAECNQVDKAFSGWAFRNAAKGVDPYRPVTANGDPYGPALDIQGFSHSSNKTFEKWHTQMNKTEALVLSECCSCTSQREDRDLPTCIADQNSPGLLPYVTGSLGVWTLMDYFGEPHGTGTSGWPYVSCDFGQFDIAGFPKPHAYWYEANWAQGFSADVPGRPAIPVKTVARVLDLPAPTANSKPTITGITTAPFAELLVDGVSAGVLQTQRNDLGEVEPTTWTITAATPVDAACTGTASFTHNASNVQCHGLKHNAATTAEECAKACCNDAHACNTWQLSKSNGCWIGYHKIGTCEPPKSGVEWQGGQRDGVTPSPSPSPPAQLSYHNATLRALNSSDPSSAELAVHTVYAPGSNNATYALQLSLDIPSVATGTGSSLVPDGRDTAFVRVAVVDESNHNALVSTATNRITWSIVSGPGRLNGISNGDPTSHEWMKSDSIDAFLGLARGLVSVAQDCTTEGRDLAAQIDQDNGPATIVPASGSCDTSDIVVQAASPGLKAAQLRIPVSVDTAKDGVLAVARASKTSGFSYLDDFVG